MIRRTFCLSAVTAGSALVSGCLASSGETTDEPTETDDAPGPRTTQQHSRGAAFERCPRLVVSIDSLPEQARQEVETALAEGRYETDGELALPQLIDPTHSYLERGGTYYRGEIDERDATERLELTVGTPSHGRHPLTVDNRNGDITVDIAITYLEGDDKDGDGAQDEEDEETPRLAESYSLAPDEQVTTREIDRALGEYRARIETAQVSTSFTWREEEHKDPLETIIVTEDDAYYEPQAVAELVQCAAVWGDG